MSRGTQVHHPGVLLLSTTGLSPPTVVLSRFIRLEEGFVTPARDTAAPARDALLPPCNIGLQTTKLQRFGLFPFRSPLLGESFSFPRGTKMFQFPHLPPFTLCVQVMVTGF